MNSHFSEEEIHALMRDKEGIHHLPRSDFAQIVRRRPYDIASGKKLIFLDLKYWISFRMAIDLENESMPTAQKEMYRQIYFGLLDLIDKGRYICTVSDSILREVEKMPLEKKLETAQIMDALGVRVVLNGMNACTFEYINIDRILAGKEPMVDYHLSLVCDSNRFLMAGTFKSVEEQPDIISNLLYDSLSRMSVEEYLRESHGGFHDSSGQFAEMFNKAKESGQPLNSFKELLIQGLKSQIAPMNEILGYDTVNKADPSIHLSYYRQYAPFLYLNSAILAAISTEGNRKFNPNDFFDLFHSCMGVGYADYFFTEKKFHHLLTTRPVDAGSIYKCKTYSDPNQILHLVKELNG